MFSSIHDITTNTKKKKMKITVHMCEVIVETTTKTPYNEPVLHAYIQKTEKEKNPIVPHQRASNAYGSVIQTLTKYTCAESRQLIERIRCITSHTRAYFNHSLVNSCT